CQDFGDREALSDLDGELDSLVGRPKVPLQPTQAAELRSKRRQVFVGLVGHENLERLLHPLDGRVQALSGELLDLAETRRHASRWMREALRPEDFDRLLVV